MNTGAAMARRELSASEAWLAVETQAISLTPVFDGAIWFASADVYGQAHNKSRAVRSLSATDSTCLGAVSKLARLLEKEQQSLGFD